MDIKCAKCAFKMMMMFRPPILVMLPFLIFVTNATDMSVEKILSCGEISDRATKVIHFVEKWDIFKTQKLRLKLCPWKKITNVRCGYSINDCCYRWQFPSYQHTQSMCRISWLTILWVLRKLLFALGLTQLQSLIYESWDFKMQDDLPAVLGQHWPLRI